MCFGVKLDKLLLDSHKRVKKDKEKNFKKKQKFFLSRLSLVVLKYLVTFIRALLLFREEEEVKEEGEDEKNTEEPQRTTSSLLLEPHLSTRDKSDHAFKRRGVEEATKKLV